MKYNNKYTYVGDNKRLFTIATWNVIQPRGDCDYIDYVDIYLVVPDVCVFVCTCALSRYYSYFVPNYND